jgi:hypothetical protein
MGCSNQNACPLTDEAPVPVENRAQLPDADFARLAQAVASHHSIKHALDWLLAQHPQLAPADLVTQDEFSHDILVPLAQDRWLVYDST